MGRYLSFWREYPHHAAIAVIAATTLVRLWFIASGQLDLVQDEAQYWDWSRHPQLSYYSKGPLIAWIIGAFTGVFGDTEFGVRFGAVLGSCLAQVLLYLGLARMMGRPRLAVLALFIANTTPLFMVAGILMTTDNPLLLCWLSALLCLHAAAVHPEKAWPWTGLTLAMALGILAKYTMLAMAAVAVLHAWGLSRHGLLPRGHWKRLLAALGCGIFAGLLPILIWNARNDWASLRHVGRLAGIAPAPLEKPPLIRLDRLPEYAGGQIGLIYPWWLAFMLYGGWRALRLVRTGAEEAGDSTPSAPGQGARPSGTRTECARGLAQGMHGAASSDSAARIRESVLLCAGFWPIFLAILAWSLHTRIYPNWSAMCYAAGFVLAAQGVDAVLEKYHSLPAAGVPWTRRLLPLWAGLSLVLCVAVHAQEPVSRLLPAKYNPASRLKGWSDLGQHLDEIRRAMPNPDTVFFFSDSYDVTAQLAFYVPGRPRAYCADFGRRLSQYDFWPGPEDRAGWDAVYVRRAPFRKPDPLLTAMFLRLGKPEIYKSRHRGGPGRTFGVMVLQGFTGQWPHTSRGIY